MARRPNNRTRRPLDSQKAVNSRLKDICNIMRRGNCAGAMQYVSELTWILFLRILDEREEREQQELEALAVQFTASLEAPYRWRDWAAPPEARTSMPPKTTASRAPSRLGALLLSHSATKHLLGSTSSRMGFKFRTAPRSSLRCHACLLRS